MSVVLRAAGATDKGRVRPTNQDYYLAEPPIFVVADGMGGHAAGEVAAKTAVLTLAEQMKRTGHGVISDLRILEDALIEANMTVWRKAGEDGSLHGMGTTVVALAPMESNGSPRLALANVGDSRAYRMSGDTMTRLTADHTLVEEMVASGELSPQQAATHPQRHILTRALGTEPEVEVDSWELVPQTGERYLLCSDGLFNEVSEAEILSVLSKLKDPERASSELVNLARAHGGSDNISVVIVDVVDAEATPQAASTSQAPGSKATNLQDAGQVVPKLQTPGRAPGQLPLPPEADVPDFFNRSLDASKDKVPKSEDLLATPTFEVSSRVRTESQNLEGKQPGETRGFFSRFRRKAPSHPTPIRSATPPGYPKSKLITWRVGLFAVGLVAICAGGYAAVDWYAHNSYFVGVSQGRVVIYSGKPSGMLWFKPKVEERTSLSTASVAQGRVQELDAGVQEPSLKEAKAFVSRLESESQQLRALGQAAG